MTTKNETEKQEQIARLREWMPKGSTVYTILRHVSASGMSRDISIVCIHPEEAGTGTRWISHPNYAVSKVLGYRLVIKNGSDAVRVNGCGMDMGHHLAHSLAHALYGDGYALSHEWL
jgi:hypothetical protein